MALKRLPREQALENDLILEHVLKLCSTTTLGNCRQISKTWHTPATKVWRSRMLARLCPDSSKDHKWSDFLKIFSKSDHTKPFVNSFIVHTISKPIWEKCGSFVKVLCLASVSFKKEDDFRNILYVALPNMEDMHLDEIWIENSQVQKIGPYTKPKYGTKPNLKSFKFTCDCKNGLCTSFSWMEFFSHFAHIEKIAVKDEQQRLDKIFQALQKIRQKDSNKLQLKHISVSSRYSNFPALPFLAQVLTDPTIQLETLTYGLEWDCDGILRTALTTHAKSLKSLKFLADSARYYRIDLLPDGVQCEVLQELDFNSEQSPLVPWLVSLLHHVPNLRKLNCSGRISSAMVLANLADVENVVLPECKEMDIKWESEDTDAADGIHLLTSWMPNLTRLTITNVTNKMFEKICANLPHLEYLELKDCHVDDCGLTGLDPDQVKEVNRKRNGWRPITKLRANITCLKRLRTFYYSTKTQSLTYCAGFCGVEQLPDLLRFKLDIAPKLFSGMYAAYWRSLTAKFPAGDVTEEIKPPELTRGRRRKF